MLARVMEPSRADLDRIKEALSDFCESRFMLDEIEDEDLKKLWNGGFKKPQLFKSARERTLEKLNISPAIIDLIMSGQKRRAAAAEAGAVVQQQGAEEMAGDSRRQGPSVLGPKRIWSTAFDYVGSWLGWRPRSRHTLGGDQLLLRDLVEEVKALKRQAEYVLDPDALDVVKKATAFLYELGENGTRLGVGVAFFVSPTCALTCHHCLPNGACIGTRIHAAVDGERTLVDIGLTVSRMNEEFDYAVLTTATTRPHLQVCTTDAPVGKGVVLCSYHMSLHQELREFEQHDIALTPGSIWKESRNGHFFLYGSACWPGDSGSAVVLYDGRVVGMHTESVNSMRQRLEEKTSTEERLSLLEESVDSAVHSLRQGAIALAARCFPVDI